MAEATQTAAHEMIAQLAARDLAIGVLELSDAAGMSLENLRFNFYPAVLADDAPRRAVDAGLARAISLDNELAHLFPDAPRTKVHLALSAARVESEDGLSSYVDDLGVDVQTARMRFLRCTYLSQTERESIKEAGGAPPALREPVRAELEDLVAKNSSLVPDGYTADLLASLLNHLLKQRVGAYARLGSESHAGWVALLDDFQALHSLNDEERAKIAGPVDYIRQMGMFTTGIQELLNTKP